MERFPIAGGSEQAVYCSLYYAFNLGVKKVAAGQEVVILLMHSND